MHLLYCDESNLEARAGEFLVYLGVSIDGAAARPLSEAITAIRSELGVPRDFRLKFNPGPEGMSHDQFIELKSRVIGAARDHGVGLLAYLVLHDIATGGPDEARRNGINTVAYHFDCVLHRKEDCGLVLIDRFNDAGNAIEAHLAEKFSVGLVGMPYSKEMPLSRILGYHYSAMGQAHFCSLVDIVTGSFRFAINAHTRKQDNLLPSARTILASLSPLFVRDKAEGPVSELGLTFSPKIVKADKYRVLYQELKGFLEEAGVPTAQPITAERNY